MRDYAYHLFLNLVSFDNRDVGMFFGEIHRDVLTVSGIPCVLNILGFAHNNSSFLSLKVTWDWNKFLVHFKCSCSLVTATAKRYDVPLLISAVSLLHMCTN